METTEQLPPIPQRRLPPGFDFKPSPQELIGYYLNRWVLGQPLNDLKTFICTADTFISVADVYAVHPEVLTRRFTRRNEAGEWFFFSRAKRQSKKSKRMIRQNARGDRWHSQQARKDVFVRRAADGAQIHIGHHQNFRFVATDGTKTEWLMEEYGSDLKEADDGDTVQVICKVYKSPRARQHHDNDDASANAAYPLPPQSPCTYEIALESKRPAPAGESREAKRYRPSTEAAHAPSLPQHQPCDLPRRHLAVVPNCPPSLLDTYQLQQQDDESTGSAVASSPTSCSPQDAPRCQPSAVAPVHAMPSIGCCSPAESSAVTQPIVCYQMVPLKPPVQVPPTNALPLLAVACSSEVTMQPPQDEARHDHLPDGLTSISGAMWCEQLPQDISIGFVEVEDAVCTVEEILNVLESSDDCEVLNFDQSVPLEDYSDLLFF